MKKNIFYWALYDFANSMLFIVFIFYFSQWLVIDRGHPVWWFNAALIGSSLLFVLSAPKVSAQIDNSKRKLPGLRVWTTISLVTFALVSALALFSTGIDVLIAVLYTFGIYAYLMCFLYFTPMLNDLSDRSNRGRVSGIGQGFNFAGQVAGLLATLPFVSGAIVIFGASARAEAFVPSVLAMTIFALPMLLLYREKKSENVQQVSVQLKPRSVLDLLKEIAANRPLAFLLLAFFFLSDAIITFSNNFSLYLEQVYGTPDTTKAMITIGILGFSIVGSVVSGFIADRFGLKKTMLALLGIWILLFCALAFIRDFSLVTVLLLAGGIFFGPIWSVSRAMVGQLSREDSEATSYSYYVVAERFATFIGPAVWSGVLIAAGEGAVGYQFALLSMALLILISLYLMTRVQEGAPAGSS